MLKFKTDAKILLTVVAEQLTDAEIAKIVLALENSLNTPGMLKLANTQVGIRVHIDGSSIKQQF